MDYMELCRLCHLLAIKIDPTVARLNKNVWLDFLENFDYKCLICNFIICNAKDYVRYDKLYEHGLSHLKNKSLLPFI